MFSVELSNAMSMGPSASDDLGTEEVQIEIEFFDPMELEISKEELETELDFLKKYLPNYSSQQLVPLFVVPVDKDFLYIGDIQKILYIAAKDFIERNKKNNLEIDDVYSLFVAQYKTLCEKNEAPIIDLVTPKSIYQNLVDNPKAIQILFVLLYENKIIKGYFFPKIFSYLYKLLNLPKDEELIPLYSQFLLEIVEGCNLKKIGELNDPNSLLDPVTSSEKSRQTTDKLNALAELLLETPNGIRFLLQDFYTLFSIKGNYWSFFGQTKSIFREQIATDILFCERKKDFLGENFFRGIEELKQKTAFEQIEVMKPQLNLAFDDFKSEYQGNRQIVFSKMKQILEERIGIEGFRKHFEEQIALLNKDNKKLELDYNRLIEFTIT